MIAEKFNTYRFADYKEKVIDLLAGDDGERGDDGGGEGDGESRTLMAKSRSVNPRRVFRLGGPCAGVKHAGLVVRRAITPVTRP